MSNKQKPIFSTNKVKLFLGDTLEVMASFKNESFDLIFADPPYTHENIDELPELILKKNKLLKPDGWFILETSHKHQYTNHPNFFRVKNYGEIHFHIFTTDLNIYARTGDWYRKRLNRHFVQAGAGLWVARSNGTTLYELERSR